MSSTSPRASTKKSAIETTRDSVFVPAPVTRADRIVLQIREFLASGILFNGRVAEKVGLGMTDMQLMHMLQLHGPSTPGKLAEWTGLSSGGITVAVDRLEKAGYLRREPNPNDRRSLIVTLVPTKLRKMAGLYEEVERETRKQIATISEKDQETVIRFFETMEKVRENRKL